MLNRRDIPPAHGFGDDQETRRLLRSRPPRTALAWASSALGGKVTAARPLRGGMSSAVHLLAVTLPGGATVKAVLRRYVRPEVNEQEPGIVDREAKALMVCSHLDVRTPRLLAADPKGTAAGVPSVLMSYLEGSVDWWPHDTQRWLGGLAGVLPPIHGAPLPPPGVIRDFIPDPQASYEPPGWGRRPKVWQRAVEIFHGPPLEEARVFLHGDFHPGNVLWHGGAVSGVVDWQAASIGPPSADVAHCRGNLLGYGPAAVRRFTRVWEQISGRVFHPWADVISVIGGLDWLRDDPPPERDAIEDRLTEAVAALRR